MAQRETKIETRDPVIKRNWTPVNDDGQPKNSNEIECDIDQTRDEMDKLMDALTYRLNPKRIMNNYKNKTMNAYNSNKAPLILAGSGILWMLWEIQNQDSRLRQTVSSKGKTVHYSTIEHYGYNDTESKESLSQKTQSGIEDVQHKTHAEIAQAKNELQSGKDTLEKHAEDFKDKFQEKVGSVKDALEHGKESAMEKGEQLQEKTRDLTEQTMERSRETMNKVSQFMKDNPLLSGLIAMSAGMITGLLLRESDTEKRLFGKTSHDLMQKAKTSTGQAIEKGKRVAEEAMDSFEEEFKNQGTSKEIMHETIDSSQKPHQKVEKLGERITEAARKATQKTENKINEEQDRGSKAA
ncbi:MAG: DUF3618 domain-containing protein [Fibrobacter sp.]|nr:DUF3618 domain-containing protein [Fibrobacter sp.]